MSTPRPATPAMLMASILYRQGAYRDLALERLNALFGPVAVQGPEFAFDQTTYYEAEMGANLRRILVGFAPLVPRESLVECKLATNALEQELADGSGRRRVNVDPGLLTVENLVLATGKNFGHRIYLGKGIYAELTLIYRQGGFSALPWTYPDYASRELQEVLLVMRQHLLAALRRSTAPDPAHGKCRPAADRTR